MSAHILNVRSEQTYQTFHKFWGGLSDKELKAWLEDMDMIADKPRGPKIGLLIESGHQKISEYWCRYQMETGRVLCQP